MAELIKLESNIWQISNLRDAVLGRLKDEGVYDSGLVYRGFAQAFIQRVLQYGSENAHELWIYGNSENALHIDPDPRWHNPLSYALHGGVLAVYDGNLLIPGAHTAYRFVSLEEKVKNLVAVFSIL